MLNRPWYQSFSCKEIIYLAPIPSFDCSIACWMSRKRGSIIQRKKPDTVTWDRWPSDITKENLGTWKYPGYKSSAEIMAIAASKLSEYKQYSHLPPKSSSIAVRDYDHWGVRMVSASWAGWSSTAEISSMSLLYLCAELPLSWHCSKGAQPGDTFPLSGIMQFFCCLFRPLGNGWRIWTYQHTRVRRSQILLCPARINLGGDWQSSQTSPICHPPNQRTQLYLPISQLTVFGFPWIIDDLWQLQHDFLTTNWRITISHIDIIK